jgi:hypothetical protein
MDEKIPTLRTEECGTLGVLSGSSSPCKINVIRYLLVHYFCVANPPDLQGATMNPLSQPVRDLSGVTSVSAVLSLLLVFCGYLAAGCGSNGLPSVTVPPPAAPAPTSVAVLVSSTANPAERCWSSRSSRPVGALFGLGSPKGAVVPQLRVLNLGLLNRACTSVPDLVPRNVNTLNRTVRR